MCMLDFVTLIFTFMTPGITFKFLRCDQNHDVKFEQLNNLNFDDFVWVLKIKVSRFRQ